MSATLLQIAQGSRGTGYQGVVLLVDRPSTPERKEIEVARCGHAHRMARTARDCAGRLGRKWRRQRAIWNSWKYDD